MYILTTICTSPIIELDTLFALPPRFCISIVFNFSGDNCNTHRKLKTKVLQTLGKGDGDGGVVGKQGALLGWLDTVFQGQYLPSLSINYVAINKVLEKLPLQLY